MIGVLFMYVAGVILTTIIASAATAPLAIYHFGRLPTFSILANVVAVPLTAFWIMPAGLLGMILLPFGLGDWCLVFMGMGIELMLAVAAWTADIPGRGRLPCATATARDPRAGIAGRALARSSGGPAGEGWAFSRSCSASCSQRSIASPISSSMPAACWSPPDWMMKKTRLVTLEKRQLGDQWMAARSRAVRANTLAAGGAGRACTRT